MNATIVILRPWMRPSITRCFDNADAADIFLRLSGFNQIDPNNWVDGDCTFAETLPVHKLDPDVQDMEHWQRSIT